MIRQSEIKHTRLIQKAEEMFIAHGYSNISIDEIALSAGISKVTIYKHFSSKEDLFVHCVINITKKHYDLLEEKLTAIDSSIDKLNYVFEYNIKSYSKYSMAFYKDMMQTPHIWDKILNYRKTRAINLCEEILQAGIEGNELRRLDIKHTVSLLLCLGESLPKVLPFNDSEESKTFMENYYNFIKFALINR